jgi:hypothetical protein
MSLLPRTLTGEAGLQMTETTGYSHFAKAPREGGREEFEIESQPVIPHSPNGNFMNFILFVRGRVTST